MAEIAAANPDRHFLVPIHWSRAIGAGVIATIIMTIVGAILKMNFPKMIGSMIVPHATLTVQYAVGGAMHFMIGIVYGIIYAALVGRLIEWNRFVKGVVYGLAITAIAFAAMPLMSAMMGGGGRAGNPCNPSSSKSAAAAQNPCHPQTGQQQAMNPCHPQGQASAMNPCHPKGAAGNPCNPCGGGSSPYSGLMSVVNHLIYALTLAFGYGKVR
ncbi:MAG TPA: hypothetical protein VII12_08785 [Thermoanaerobaculia bacterium]